MNPRDAGGDLALIQTSQLLSCKCTCNLLALEQLDLHNESSEVCIKTRSTPASQPFKNQVTEWQPLNDLLRKTKTKKRNYAKTIRAPMMFLMIV